MMNSWRLMNGVVDDVRIGGLGCFTCNARLAITFFRNIYTSRWKRIYLSVEMYGCFFKGLACGASFRQDGARKAGV